MVNIKENISQNIFPLGLGTMYFGTKVDEKTSFSLLDLYFEYGGNFFDSANKYASWVSGYKGGESESVLGKWVRSRKNREQIFITSKVGFPYGNIPRSLKKDIIIFECEKSLKRLGVDVIDFYFAHAEDINTPQEESMEAFFQLKKQGKIRFVAVSNYSLQRLTEANLIARNNGWEGFCCLQQRYSYLEPLSGADFGNQLVLTPEMVKYCQAENMLIMGYSPLLAGGYSKGWQSIPDEYKSGKNKNQFEILEKVAKDMNVTVNQLVLYWMVSSTPRVIPMVAASSVLQLKENMDSLKIELPEKYIALMRK